jgi:hypothetical protein
MGPSYFLLRPQQLAKSSSFHLVVSGTRCLSKSLKSVNRRCAVINRSVLNKRSKTGWCKGIYVLLIPCCKIVLCKKYCSIYRITTVPERDGVSV